MNKGLLLLSGGIDSPVAGHLMMEKGMEVAMLHFSNSPSGASSAIARELTTSLSSLYRKSIRLYIVANHGNEEMISRMANRRYQCLICKRLMYRIAQKIAIRDGYDYLITGENLGQVASQTLDNLAVLDDAAGIIVLRPLICHEKSDTILLSKVIGSYDISIRNSSKCPYVPSNPVTRASKEELVPEEERLPIQQMVENSLDIVETY
jgi:tRNA uracil 4-sulfurtransferase